MDCVGSLAEVPTKELAWSCVKWNNQIQLEVAITFSKLTTSVFSSVVAKPTKTSNEIMLVN
jgi:hypothetical protein